MGKGNIVKMLRLAESPAYIALHMLCACLANLKSGVLPVVFINLFLRLMDERDSLGMVFGLAGGYGVLLLVVGAFTVWFEDYYKPAKLPRIQGKLKEKLFLRSVDSELGDFDDAGFYNEYVWTMTNAEETANGMIAELSGLAANLSVTFFICGMMLQIDLIATVAVFCSVMVTALLFARIIRLNYARDVKASPFMKKREYYKRVFYLKDYGKELRLTAIGGLMMEQFEGNEESICRIYGAFGKKLCRCHVLNGLTISTFLDIGLRLLLTYELMVMRTITISEYVASTFAIWSLFSALNGIMANVHGLSEYSLRAGKILCFLNRKSMVYAGGRKRIPSSDTENTIRCDNLCFAYAGKTVIDHLSFEWREGETLAIVGENGSGKSTLVKLLLGLYMPDAGDILVNGQRLEECRIETYRGMFSVIFQDFSFFPASIAQNLMLDLSWEEKELRDALEKGFYYQDDCLKKIPLDAVMTKEFDENGIVLSEGQAQKLVTARAFLNPPFVIMDEPSSKLDVSSEMELNELILRNTGRKGMIVIAHRLTTTKNADRILVLSKGKKVEEGTHRELMGKRGHYYRMFTAQGSQYQ